MTFFYDLNKRLSQLAAKQDAKQLTESAAVAEKADYSAKKAAAGQDIGKPGKMFSKIAKSAGKEYGSKAAGERVAGAVLNKLRSKNESADQDGDIMDYLNDKLKDFDAQQSKTDESALQAYIGDKKYGKAGMDALRKAGREGASQDKMSQIRNRYNKMDEADMEEGNEFSGELAKAKATGAKQFNVDGKTYPVREAAKPDYIDLDKDGNRKETMKKAAADKKKSRSAGTAFDPEVAKSMTATDKHPRYDVKDTGYSTRYTRKVQDEPKDDAEVSTEPKKKGRPKGPAKGPERVTAKSYKYKAGRPAKTKEDLDTDGVMMTRASNMSSESADPADRGEYDREGDMAKEQMHTIVSAAKELHRILRDDENLPEWVQKKITLAKEYIDTARDYMLTQHAERAEEQPIAEKAVSKKQQKFMGMVHAAQKGERPASGAVAKVAKSMGKKDAEDFAATKHKGLPEKVKAKKKEKDMDESSTTAGSVSTAPVASKASKGGYNFGGGVYESLNTQFRAALNEGMNVSVNMSAGQDGEPTKNITISADGEDADRLAELLKMAGLGGQESSCNTCGKTPCGCESLDENSPDWPTNTETSDDAMQYSGGLNGPKSTGQSTTPVLASQLRRQVSMEEGVALERNLLRLYQNYKAQ